MKYIVRHYQLRHGSNDHYLYVFRRRFIEPLKKAWITTNGLNCGVAALIGSARRELGRELGDTIPIIGFPRWEEIKDNEQLIKAGPSQVNFSSKSGVQYYTKDLGRFLIFITLFHWRPYAISDWLIHKNQLKSV